MHSETRPSIYFSVQKWSSGLLNCNVKKDTKVAREKIWVWNRNQPTINNSHWNQDAIYINFIISSFYSYLLENDNKHEKYDDDELGSLVQYL